MKKTPHIIIVGNTKLTTAIIERMSRDFHLGAVVYEQYEKALTEHVEPFVIKPPIELKAYDGGSFRPDGKSARNLRREKERKAKKKFKKR